MNNWQSLKLGSMEEGIIYVLGYLKENEERIMSKSVDNEAVVTCGDLVLTLKQKKVKSKKK